MYSTVISSPQDDPEAPLTEEEYRRRRPHPSFKEHHSLEKLVLKLGRDVSKGP